MTLELADLSITEPIGIAKDVRLMVGKFQFPADFVVVDFEPDPRVPLILGRSFLKTSRALIDVYEGEITLHVGKEAITFNLDQTSRYTDDYNHMTANRIDVIELACEEYSQEVLGFSDSVAYGNPSPDYNPIVSNSSPILTPFRDKELKVVEAKTVKSSIDEPPEVELKDLPPHLEYAFLEGDNKLPVIIAKDLKDEEKAALTKVLKSHKRAIAWKLSDIKGVDPRSFVLIHGFPLTRRIKRRQLSLAHTERSPIAACLLGYVMAPCTFPNDGMMAIFHDMIEKTMEVFMDDFSVFGDSFSTCLSHLEKMLKRCEDTNLSLNWEKSHFMVKEGIVLGHKISKSGIEVDRGLKLKVITKPHTRLLRKGVRSFLGHASFLPTFNTRRFEPFARPMDHFA
ncbi:reverse transcriptase domain-containing protein [Tanacetum coccineum]